jgi:hypothetical protein
MSHYEIEFRNANVLASHKGASYNPPHRCSSFATPLSPPPPSFGGLNPNRSFGFFFARFCTGFYRAQGLIPDGREREWRPPTARIAYPFRETPVHFDLP